VDFPRKEGESKVIRIIKVAIQAVVSSVAVSFIALSMILVYYGEWALSSQASEWSWFSQRAASFAISAGWILLKFFFDFSGSRAIFRVIENMFSGEANEIHLRFPNFRVYGFGLLGAALLPAFSDFHGHGMAFCHISVIQQARDSLYHSQNYNEGIRGSEKSAGGVFTFNSSSVHCKFASW
jgi:hypothetical protein